MIGYARPIGLCGCCPPPGKPVVVRYDLDAIRADSPTGAVPWTPARGIWRFERLLPVLGVPSVYAADSPRGYLDELERRGLVVQPAPGSALVEATRLLADPAAGADRRQRRDVLLRETADIVPWAADLVEGTGRRAAASEPGR